mgnify:CR=1 FL=1
MKYENKLNEYPIFSNLIDTEIKKFKEKIELINFKSDDLIIKEGQEGKSILFLFEGDINISQALTLITNKSDSEDNREKELIRLSSMNQHISLGEISLFNVDKKRSATVKAISNCEVGRLTFDDLFEICDKNHDIGYKVMKNIGDIITKHLIKSNHKVLKLTTAISLLIDN